MLLLPSTFLSVFASKHDKKHLTPAIERMGERGGLSEGSKRVNAVDDTLDRRWSSQWQVA
jgi:hypothetical protein